jgi:hypothetical protein
VRCKRLTRGAMLYVHVYFACLLACTLNACSFVVCAAGASWRGEGPEVIGRILSCRPPHGRVCRGGGGAWRLRRGCLRGSSPCAQLNGSAVGSCLSIRLGILMGSCYGLSFSQIVAPGVPALNAGLHIASVPRALLVAHRYVCTVLHCGLRIPRTLKRLSRLAYIPLRFSTSDALVGLCNCNKPRKHATRATVHR